MDFLIRIYRSIFPSAVPKLEEVVRIGLLGASNIAPQAVISPAKTHTEVVIAAVAARDVERARKYARKFGIGKVFKDYDELINDPNIDAVYIALPNGLHYEWALKCLKAGKHVLLEKPSTSNTSEAVSLFHHELLKQPNSPVLLEAFHVVFHPAWQTFLSLLDSKNIASAHTLNHIPRGVMPPDDIRFIYEIAGGALMDLGTYNILQLRQIFSTEPEACLEATPIIMAKGYDQKCDRAMTAKWRFPNGGIGTIDCDLSVRGAFGLPGLLKMYCTVVHKEFVIKDADLQPGREHVMVKTVTILNGMFPSIWHRIDVSEQHTIRTIDKKEVVKTWTHKESKKAYTWGNENGTSRVGEPSWSTYRHQLEQFVNRIKGREGSGFWISGEDSIRQMEAIDSAYEKAGLPLRPTRIYE